MFNRVRDRRRLIEAVLLPGLFVLSSAFVPSSYAVDEVDFFGQTGGLVDTQATNLPEISSLMDEPTLAVLSNSPDLAKMLDELQNRVELLEAGDKPKNSKTTAAAKSGAKPPDTNEIPLDRWQVKLGGHVQLDYVTWADADPAIADADNYFSYRRLRLVADGVGYEQFDFRLQMTLEPGQGSTDNISASPDVKDAYFSMNEIPGLGRFRVGNFFVPFSLEQVTNDTNNIFSERSIPTETVFAASRELGAALYNCTSDERITWTGGIFFDDINDTVKTRFDDNQGLRLSGRLTALPYFDHQSGGRYLVHVGAGVLHTDDHDDTVRFRARPQVQRGPVLIDTGNLAADTFTTGNLELAIVWGSVALQAEAFISDVALQNSPSAQLSGGYAHISYFLTGEHRNFEPFGQHGAQFGRNKPIRDFRWLRGATGPGAWEAKVRWSNADFTEVNAGTYNDVTLGFNWYWSDRTRWMFDWIHPVTDAQTSFGETESDLMAMRFDFNW